MCSSDLVEADHLPPAGLLYPLPVPRLHAASASTRCIILDFIELHVARSGHDFLQVHISLPTDGCGWSSQANPQSDIGAG